MVGAQQTLAAIQIVVNRYFVQSDSRGMVEPTPYNILGLAACSIFSKRVVDCWSPVLPTVAMPAIGRRL